jgi:hypothetical protein
MGEWHGMGDQDTQGAKLQLDAHAQMLVLKQALGLQQRIG